MRNITYGDISIPAIGLGTWKSSKGEVYSAVREAIHVGYRHIDCAPAYENEEEVGAALNEMINAGNISRGSVWITSKLWNNAHRPEDVEPALKKTLTDLQLDYLDLYLIHWPVAFRPGVFFPRQGSDFLSLEEIPIIETWQAMEECVAAGLTKCIGVCNFSISNLEDLVEKAETKPMMNQIELHPYLQQEKMVSFCKKKEILLTAYSPLGSADRPKRLKKESEPQLLENQTIVAIAKKHKATSAQILIAWALQRDTVVIPKSVTPERIRDNLDSEKVVLDKEDMAQITELDMGYRYVDGSFWESPGSGYTVKDIWDS